MDRDTAIVAAQAAFDREAFRTLITDLVNIPSPTGEEATLAAYCAAYFKANGLSGAVQSISETQANAIGRYAPTGGCDGPGLLLYANLDTHMGAGDEDEPWAGQPYPQILKPEARWNGDEISGLCAENPKGYAAAVMAAAASIARAGIELRGELTVGLGAGGMTVLRRPGWSNRYIGAGNGALFMLQRSVTPDYCIMCKPIYAVSWEEVGICFYRVRIKGGIGYCGIRHLLPDDPNPLPKVSRVIDALEAWFPDYARRHSSGLVEPWGGISAINGGWDFKPIISPACVDIIVDVRPSPRSSPADVGRELRSLLDQLMAEDPTLDIDLSLELAVPGSHTPPDNWIIRSTIHAWEQTEARKHEPFGRTSGYTDISIIRQWGIPAARIGAPLRVRDPDPTDTLPMNRLHLDDAERLIKVLIRSAIDTCSRTLSETRAP